MKLLWTEVGHWGITALLRTYCNEGWGRSSVVEHLSSVHKNLNFIPSTVKRKRERNSNIFWILRYQELRDRHGMGLSSYVPNPDIRPVAQEAGALSRARFHNRTLEVSQACPVTPVSSLPSVCLFLG